MLNRAALIFLSCFVLQFAFSQETLTVDQAVEIALKNNFDIQLARNEAEIAARNNSIGNAGMLPVVNAGVSDNYTLNNLHQKFTNATEINKNSVTGSGITAGVALNWT